MTAVEFLEYFRIWGPLGIIAALSLWGNVHQYKNGRADAKTNAAETKAQRDAADAALKLQRDAADAAIAAQTQSHNEQMTEMTNRFVQLVQEGATENRELTKEVRGLIEVVSRKRR